MTTLTIKTTKGATITLNSVNGSVEALVNGKMHSPAYATVTLSHDAQAGNHITLVGNVRASVNDADLDAIRDFFAAAKVEKAAWGKSVVSEYLASSEASADRMEARMYGKNSIH